MKLPFAVSNLAWDPKDDIKVTELFNKYGIKHVELAPTKIWPDLDSVSQTQLKTYRALWNNKGIEIHAFQSLLFGLNDVNIFDPISWPTILNRISRLNEIGTELGVKVMVFGSPKQRQRQNIPLDHALRTARDFFKQAADICAKAGITLVLEANPKSYGCDFLTDATSAEKFVHNLNHPNLKPHLDLACERLEGFEPEKTFPTLAGKAKHFHITSPQLARPTMEQLKQDLPFVLSLGSVYSGVFSVEYLAAPDSKQALTELENLLKDLTTI